MVLVFLIHIGDMNLVLPIINLSILDPDILIIMQQLIFGWLSTGDHPETLVLFEFFCWTPPSCLKVIGGWWPTGFYCQPQAPFGFNWVLVLIGTWLGLGLGDLGAEGLGPGLDNKKIAHCKDLINYPKLFIK